MILSQETCLAAVLAVPPTRIGEVCGMRNVRFGVGIPRQGRPREFFCVLRVPGGQERGETP